MPFRVRSATEYRLVFVLVLAVQLLAIWLPPWNALTDYPIHIVRAYILANYDTSPYFQQLFQKAMIPNPNMAIDYLATPLIPLLGMIVAGKVFLSLIVVVFDAGCHFLGRAIQGSLVWTSPVCALLAFHGAYQYGFANYCFSVGWMMLCLAFWLRRRDAWDFFSLLGFAILITALFIAHLAGFGAALFAIGFSWLCEIAERRKLSKRILLEAAVFVPSAAIWVLLPHTHSVTLHPGLFELSTLPEKAAAAFTLFRSGNMIIDVPVLLVVLAVMLLALRYRGAHEKTGLRAGLSLCVLFLIVPKRFLVNASGDDVRLIIPGLLLCMLSLRLPGTKLVSVVGLLLAALLCLRLVYQVEMFRRASRVTESVVQLVDRIPSGVEFWMFCEERRMLRQSLHAGDYGLARSGAIASNYFAIPSSQPIWFRQPLRGAPEYSSQLTDDVVRRGMERRSFAVVCGFEASRDRLLGRYAEQVAASGPCSLWKAR
jgi:hypothetical protein